MCCCCCSVSHVHLFATPWTATCQASLSFTISQSLLKLMSQWWDPTNLSIVVPFSSCLQSFPASGSFPVSWLFTSGGQSIGASAFSSSSEYSGLSSLRIDWFDFQGTQDSSPTLQLESINSSALRLLYGPTVTSICDYWKNHAFDYKHLCWISQIYISDLIYIILWGNKQIWSGSSHKVINPTWEKQ